MESARSEEPADAELESPPVEEEEAEKLAAPQILPTGEVEKPAAPKILPAAEDAVKGNRSVPPTPDTAARRRLAQLAWWCQEVFGQPVMIADLAAVLIGGLGLGSVSQKTALRGLRSDARNVIQVRGATEADGCPCRDSLRARIRVSRGTHSRLALEFIDAWSE